VRTASTWCGLCTNSCARNIQGARFYCAKAPRYFAVATVRRASKKDLLIQPLAEKEYAKRIHRDVERWWLWAVRTWHNRASRACTFNGNFMRATAMRAVKLQRQGPKGSEGVFVGLNARVNHVASAWSIEGKLFHKLLPSMPRV
jgi:hypothetical protein